MSFNSKSFACIFLVAMTLAASHQGFAHKGEKHEGHHNDAPKLSADTIKLASKLYSESVQAIFRKSCFDCHGIASEMPWYNKVPGVKDLIAKDIAEAKKHLDMSKGFPFEGHGSAIEDLDAIQKSVEANEMPPASYRTLHPKSELSSADKETIRSWVELTKKALE